MASTGILYRVRPQIGSPPSVEQVLLLFAKLISLLEEFSLFQVDLSLVHPKGALHVEVHDPCCSANNYTVQHFTSVTLWVRGTMQPEAQFQSFVSQAIPMPQAPSRIVLVSNDSPGASTCSRCSE